MFESKELDLLRTVVENTNPKGLSRSLLCNHPEFYEKLKMMQQKSKFKNLAEYIYWILNDITSIPICPTCNKTELKFKGIDIGYQKECGKCSVSKTLKNTMLEKYGVDNAAHISGMKEKKKQTCLEKYGKEHHTQTKEVQDKKKETLQQRYGVDAPLQAKQFKNKVKETCLEKYGVDHHTKTEAVQDKKRQTCIERYDATNVMQCETIKNKFKETYYRNSNFFEYAEKLAKSKGVTLISYDTALKPVIFKCDTCSKEFKIIWNSFQQNGCVCPHCYPKNHGISKQEKDIVEFIKSSTNLPIEENTRKLISPFELDIVIPSKSLAIEYCGLYFHSSGPNSHNDKPKNYHFDKLKRCTDSGYRLITIFEDEWIKHPEIVKSKILQSLELFDGERIYARSCNVINVDSKTKKKFIDTYHLQGDFSSSINLGLIFDNDLVAIMTFLTKGNDVWELSRFCCKENTQIVGGAGKLLSHFKNKHIWKLIYTYADRRWSDGSFYETLGFSLSHETSPNYWYWGNNIVGRKHRLNYSKSKLKDMSSFDESLTEFQIMALEGYSWIYDCGNLKYYLKK